MKPELENCSKTFFQKRLDNVKGLCKTERVKLKQASLKLTKSTMTKSNSPTPNRIDSLKAYKELPVEERCAILSAVCNLEPMRINGNPLSKEVMFEKLMATGHLDIALDCYAARLTGNQQWV